MRLGLVVFLILETLVAAQVVLANGDSMLTVREMHNRGITQGLPLIWHFGIWGDVFLISPLAAVIVGLYRSEWTIQSVGKSALLCAIMTILLANIYVLGGIQEAHLIDRQHTAAGYVHLIYTSICLTILFLFFFFSPTRPAFVILVSFLLIAHMLLGLHFILALLQYAMPLSWYPRQPFGSPVGWGIFVSAVVFLAWRVVEVRSRHT